MNIKAAKLQTFVWTGTDDRGEKLKGELNAASIVTLKVLLRKQGIIPLRVRKKPRAIFRSTKIRSKDITYFTRQMATMLSSGIPLSQAFDIVGKGHSNPKMQKLIGQLKADVEEGHTFVESLKKHPKYFNDLYCSLVAAGEQAGALDITLDRLATHKEKTESLKAKIRKAMFYPAAVICVAIIVTAALMIFVVPQFQSLFQGFGADLPVFTRMVIGVSEFVQSYWWLIFAGVIMMVSGFIFMRKRSKKFAFLVDRIILKLPIFGVIIQKAAIARFSRTLATAFAAGVPLTDALQSVAKSTGSLVYNQATVQINRHITKGQQLQLAVRSTGLFPEMVVQMITIGEESGALEKMLSKVADFFEEEVDNAVDSLSTLIEPIIMSILGVLVGGLVIAMYLPIFKLGAVI